MMSIVIPAQAGIQKSRLLAYRFEEIVPAGIHFLDQAQLPGKAFDHAIAMLGNAFWKVRCDADVERAVAP